MRFSKIHVPLILGLLLSLSLFAQNRHPIRVNQEGYFVNAPKFASWVSTAPATPFYIVNLERRDTVFKGISSGPKNSGNSSLQVHMLDFSSFQTEGEYVIRMPGTSPSYRFTINAQPLHVAAVASLKGFYFQRSAMPLAEEYAGQWTRPAGHPDNKVLIHASAVSPKRPAGTVIASPGGWYDAGDYNKYIVNSGITMGTLLSAYEDFAIYFDTLRTHIPESGNKIPDILDEALYNLRWMLTMQDPADGGVYHKCTNASFDGMVMPGVTTLPRYVVMKSTAAALDFAAVTAQASRVFSGYRKELPGLADSCAKASRQAWEWAKKNPDILYDQDAMNKKFSPPVTTGAYGDGTLWDEWSWAASELYVTNRNTEFLDTIKAQLEHPITLASWSEVSTAGYYSLARFENKLPSGAKPVVETLKSRIIQFADSLLLNQSANAFHSVIGGSPKDFIWGSNAVAANQAIVLINAAMLTHDRKYLDGALSNADYILGRNATGYCFVTGIGSYFPMHPHHRPSVADGIAEPVPGLLVGGPNSGKQDKCNYAFSEPETTYLDADCSYASNEIAINWNAPLVYLLNGLEYLYVRKP